MRNVFYVTPWVISGILCFAVLSARLGNRLEVPGALAQIEQLREDVRRVNAASNEDVIGQVTHWNQQIKRNQAYRQVWWGRLVIPESWEQVSLIQLP